MGSNKFVHTVALCVLLLAVVLLARELAVLFTSNTSIAPMPQTNSGELLLQVSQNDIKHRLEISINVLNGISVDHVATISVLADCYDSVHVDTEDTHRTIVSSVSAHSRVPPMDIVLRETGEHRDVTDLQSFSAEIAKHALVWKTEQGTVHYLQLEARTYVYILHG